MNATPQNPLDMQILRLPLLAIIRALPLAALLIAAPTFALDAREIYQSASPSIVRITIMDANNRVKRLGSGFFVGNGRVIVTNYHVIEAAAIIQAETIIGDVFQIRTVLGIDKARDLALLQSPQPGCPLALSAHISEIGEPVIALGNPKGFDRTLSQGVISGVRRKAGDVIYQIDAAISGGSSGGPILDKHGQVIGVATFFHRDGQNLNFAYSSEYVRDLLASSGSVATAKATEEGVSVWIKPIIRAADRGDAEAQFHLGRMYVNGEGVPQNNSEAVKWLRRAAEQEHVNAQSHLGWIYINGEIAPQDYSESVKWYRRAAERGDAYSQSNLGFAYANGKGVPQDYIEAMKWTRRAAEQGYADAQYNLSLMYVNGKGASEDHAEAVKWARRAAQQGHTNAQGLLGGLYYFSEDIQNYAEAMKWTRSSAERENVRAQYILGMMYIAGKGISIDHAEAKKWWQRAAEQGDGYAEMQYNISMMYANGEGVSQDYVEAVKWTRRAAEQGHIKAQYNLGYAYANGKGIEQNDSEAVNWYRRAAEQGDVRAQFNLGSAYFDGIGVPQNHQEAYIWYSLSAANGDIDAVELRDSAADKLFPTDLTAAQKKAEQLHKKIQSKSRE